MIFLRNKKKPREKVRWGRPLLRFRESKTDTNIKICVADEVQIAYAKIDAGQRSRESPESVKLRRCKNSLFSTPSSVRQQNYYRITYEKYASEDVYFVKENCRKGTLYIDSVADNNGVGHNITIIYPHDVYKKNCWSKGWSYTRKWNFFATLHFLLCTRQSREKRYMMGKSEKIYLFAIIHS